MAQYKFKSSNDTFSVKFDGPHIPLIELREKIVAEQKIVKGKDLFVLELSNPQTGEVYEENALIPRNTAVLVKRVPQLRREAIVGTAVDEEGAGQGSGIVGTGEPTEAGNADSSDVVAAAAMLPVPGIAAAEAAARAAAAARAGGGSYGTKLIDPLSGRVFVDAVITTCCGTSFSKEPLHQYIKQKGECPSCRVNWQANGTKVLPNRSLREAVLKAQEAAAEAVGGGAGGEHHTMGPQQPQQPLPQQPPQQGQRNQLRQPLLPTPLPLTTLL